MHKQPHPPPSSTLYRVSFVALIVFTHTNTHTHAHLHKHIRVVMCGRNCVSPLFIYRPLHVFAC